MNIGILNFKTGNLKSIIYIIKKLPINVNIYFINKNFNNFQKIDKIIIPGQSSSMNLIKNIISFNLEGFYNFLRFKPTLGICLGKQIFFNKLEESSFFGFKIFDGVIKKFKIYKNFYKIPNIGWNNIFILKNHFLLKNLKKNDKFYFSHSFYLISIKKEFVFALTKYNSFFSSIFIKDNLFLTQFHPEKSGAQGVKIFNNFLNWKIKD